MATNRFAAGLCAGTALMLAAEASAQVAPAPTREEVRRPELQDTPPTARQPAVEGGIERAPCPLAQPRFADIRFTLREVVFDNLVGFSPAGMQPAYADMIGRELPIAAICEIRDRAATMLRDAGYLAAVQVPPQEIEDGLVRFDVLAARIARLQVRGQPGNSERLLESYLAPLGEQPAFNQREAERSLLLAGELPGYDTRLSIRPADGEPGDVIGDVLVARTKWVIDGNIQNYGSKATGRFGGQVRAQVNDVTGLGDRTAFSFFSTADFDEQLVVNLLHDFAIGGDGLRVGGEFTYGWNDPTIGGLSPFDTETMVASLRGSYPFILDQGTRLEGRWGFDFIDQDVEFGGVPLNRDRLRIGYAGLSLLATDRASIEGANGFSAAEPRWRFGLSGELRQGFDIFDASDRGFAPGMTPQTRTAGDSRATVLRAEGLVEFRPTPRLAWVLETRLQLTGDPLLAYEEFAGGNYTVGRGYDPGAILGDRGFGFRSEIRAGSIVPQNDADLALQPYGFFDAAWVDNEDPRFFGLPNSDEIFSLGGGIRFNYGNRARLDVALAVPLERTNFQASTPDPRLLVSLFVRFAR